MEQRLNLRELSKLGTIRQLEIFLKVAERGSIARAAEELHLTQPSVSIQIRKLSEAVGLPLYEIIGKSLALTPAGDQVQAAGKEIFASLLHLDNSLNALKGLEAGHLSVSVVTTAQYFMPYVLAPFSELYPGIDIELHTGNRDAIVERMKANKDEFYIFSELPEDIPIETFPFLPNPIAVVASKEHHLAGSKNLTWEDIEGERFITREPGSGAMKKIIKHLQTNDLQMHNVMTIRSNEAIKHAVMANMGISIMSAYILSNADHDGLTQLDVEGFPLMSQWKVVQLKHKKLSPVGQRFLNFVLENGREVLPMKKIEKNIQSAMDGTWGQNIN